MRPSWRVSLCIECVKKRRQSESCDRQLSCHPYNKTRTCHRRSDTTAYACISPETPTKKETHLVSKPREISIVSIVHLTFVVDHRKQVILIHRIWPRVPICVSRSSTNTKEKPQDGIRKIPTSIRLHLCPSGSSPASCMVPC